MSEPQDNREYDSRMKFMILFSAFVDCKTILNQQHPLDTIITMITSRRGGGYDSRWRTKGQVLRRCEGAKTSNSFVGRTGAGRKIQY
jgi:hypothetical protein